jgi:hypothetical protein
MPAGPAGTGHLFIYIRFSILGGNMDLENRINEIDADFQETKDELQDILFDIRTYLMEALSPIPNDLDKEKLREEMETDRG